MRKTKLFIDFDSTITDSLKTFVTCYNIRFKKYENYRFADWTKVEKYNFHDQCPLIENVHDIFESDLFFEYLDFINSNTYEILQKLNEKYEIYIATIGTLINLCKKAVWINENLPFIKHYTLLYDSENTMNKSVINMQCEGGSIFIDDVLSNLTSSNADFKFIFGDEYEWNLTSDYTRVYNWTDVENMLI